MLTTILTIVVYLLIGYAYSRFTFLFADDENDTMSRGILTIS